MGEQFPKPPPTSLIHFSFILVEIMPLIELWLESFPYIVHPVVDVEISRETLSEAQETNRMAQMHADAKAQRNRANLATIHVCPFDAGVVMSKSSPFDPGNA